MRNKMLIYFRIKRINFLEELDRKITKMMKKMRTKKIIKSKKMIKVH
jgi:hypothetical protein